MKALTAPPRNARLAIAALALLGTTAVTQAQKEQPADYAILIVGDESNAELLRREKVLIQEMAKNLKKPQRLPIYSYHFNKERERTYCEKKLNVLREDLLFIGIVSLSERVPRKVLYRIDRVATPSRAAVDIVARADELNPEEAAVTPSPSSSPESTPAPVNTTNGQSGGRFRVQLGAFSQQKSAQDLVDSLRSKGYDAKFDKLQIEGKESFKVWVGTFQTKEDAQQASTELQADGFEKGFVVESR